MNAPIYAIINPNVITSIIFALFIIIIGYLCLENKVNDIDNDVDELKKFVCFTTMFNEINNEDVQNNYNNLQQDYAKLQKKHDKMFKYLENKHGASFKGAMISTKKSITDADEPTAAADEINPLEQARSFLSNKSSSSRSS